MLQYRQYNNRGPVDIVDNTPFVSYYNFTKSDNINKPIGIGYPVVILSASPMVLARPPILIGDVVTRLL